MLPQLPTRAQNFIEWKEIIKAENMRVTIISRTSNRFNLKFILKNFVFLNF